MNIGAISFQPYVYNINAVSPASMNRLSRISDNVLDKKTDYSGLTEAENENPLKRGQTLNFQSMLEMQMQRGRSNAARIMKPVEEEKQGTARAQETAVQFNRASDAAKTGDAAALETVQENTANGNMGGDISNFRMQQAISAYETFMTA